MKRHELWTDFNSKSPTGLYTGQLPNETYHQIPQVRDRVVLFDDDGLELEGEVVRVGMAKQTLFFIVLVDEGAADAGDS